MGCGASTTSTPTASVSHTGDSQFFAPTGTRQTDTFTAANHHTYRVRADGHLVRTDGQTTLVMPVVGEMLGQGVQTRDHDATLATVRVIPTTVRAEITFLKGSTIATATALRGVAVEGHHYAVFVVTPAIGPDAIQSVTQTDASGHAMGVTR